MKKQNESKINDSSEESAGEDHSFEDDSKVEQYEDSQYDYESLKNKWYEYRQAKNDKCKFPNWSSVYNTFFLGNANHTENTSLSEFDLRCKILRKNNDFKNNKLDNKSKEKNAKINKTQRNCNYNIKKIIDKYSHPIVYKKEKSNKHNTVAFNPIEETNLSKNNPDRMNSMISIIKGLKKSSSVITSTHRKGSIKFPNREDENDFRKNEVFTEEDLELEFNNKKLNKRSSSLFDLFDIKDAPFMIPNNRKTKDTKKSSLVDDDNYNNLLLNKAAYIVELENYKSFFNKSKQIDVSSLNCLEYLINFKDAENFYELLAIKKHKFKGNTQFHGEYEKLEDLSKKINILHNKYIDKLDDNKKLFI
jgi:hypothetical protein